eukprot:scaffold48981_cov19-Tisochrysis_lutea.AAC.1
MAAAAAAAAAALTCDEVDGYKVVPPLPRDRQVQWVRGARAGFDKLAPMYACARCGVPQQKRMPIH